MPLPIDVNGNAIPAMRLTPNGGHTIAATTGAAAKNTVPFMDTTRVVSVYAEADIWIAFGADNTVDVAAGGAGVHHLPGGTYYDFSIGGFKNQGSDGSNVPQSRYIAVRSRVTGGGVYISEKD